MNHSKNFLKAIRRLLRQDHNWTYLNPATRPVEPARRLYVVVRNDLAPGIQISQSIHAKDEFTREHGDIEDDWRWDSNTIIILSGTSHQLYSILGHALTNEVYYSTFKEPQLNNELTAIALEPSEATVEIVRGLPLALKELL